MPDQIFHTQKRDGFRNSGRYLQQHGPPDSADAAVQDFFYSAMHDVERFLSLFGQHANHRRRKDLILNEQIIKRRNRVFIGSPVRPRRRGEMRENVLDSTTEMCYFALFAMRQLKAYGSLPTNVPIPSTVGGRRFADAIDVNDAWNFFITLRRSLTGHENNLHRKRIL